MTLRNERMILKIEDRRSWREDVREEDIFVFPLCGFCDVALEEVEGVEIGWRSWRVAEVDLWGKFNLVSYFFILRK